MTLDTHQLCHQYIKSHKERGPGFTHHTDDDCEVDPRTKLEDYPHVVGRRNVCLSKTQILELIDAIDPTGASEGIAKVRKRVEQL